jgi:WD40 repeat protein
MLPGANSDTLLASSDHVARLWDLNSGETVRQYSGHHRSAVIKALQLACISADLITLPGIILELRYAVR